MAASQDPWRADKTRLTAELKRHLLLFFSYFTQYLKVRVSYRGDFIISLLTSFAATIFGLAFVVVLFQRAPKLSDWTFPEEMFLYGFALIPYGIFNIISVNLYDFGNNYIIEGKFDRVLLRPISSLFQILFETFRIESIQEIGAGVFCTFWASQRLHVQWTPAKIAMFLFWGTCAGVIYISVFLILTTVSFWFEDRIGVHPSVWNIIAFGRWPLSIYSGAVQFFLCWIIPFGLASFYPSVRMLGRAVRPEYAPLVPLVSLAFATLGIVLWSIGTRHYSSTGS